MKLCFSTIILSVCIELAKFSHIPTMNENSPPRTRSWKFSVIHHEEPETSMCITGDCESLGNWQSDIIVPLIYDESSKIWSIKVNIPSNRDVQYRYYTCTRDHSFSPPKTMINQWETNLQPRLIKQNQEQRESDQLDVFGIFDGIQKLENGWLVNDVAIELRIYKNSIQWVPECRDKKVNVKLKRSSRSHCDEKLPQKSGAKNSSDILISVSNGNGKFRKQNENGYPQNEIESAAFVTRTFTLEQQGFVFEFIDKTDNQHERNYFAYVMFDKKFHGSEGFIKTPIHSVDHEYLGSLTVKYLIIRPSPAVNCSFKASYSKYWNNLWSGLEIGHRGAGISFSPFFERNAKWRENTIGSFNLAARNGAHLIELDVQLTKDKIPVVYHDFHVLVDVRRKLEKPKRNLMLPFHELNYEELTSFQVHHRNEMNETFSFENDGQDDYLPFPLLEQVLHAVDPQIGINVEVKYTSMLHDGQNEYDHPIDMNEYIDKILQVVFANAGLRYIVFSSFNPDICTMARLKQNKYPVMFLTQGVTKRYPPYSDPRMWNVENAINFANSEDLLGIVAHSEDLLDDSNLTKLILNNHLVLFCWGEDNNDRNNITKLKQQGVHGVIFDKDPLRPVVKLQRIRTVIKCPGCIKFFYIEDECAAHLLKSCIQFSSNDTSESRRNLAIWIVEYFKTYAYGEQNPSDAVKVNSLLNDDRSPMTLKSSLRVQVTQFSSLIRCPICCTFAFTAEACFEHLFSKCLYVENDESSLVCDWLAGYFSKKSEKNLNILRDVLSNYSASRITCKYCKAEAPDQPSLMKHFPCSQRRVGNTNELMCELCNFSVPNLQRLITHLISKHCKCHNCGIWPKNRRVDFVAFKNHVQSCDPQGYIFFRCPLCSMNLPIETEENLTAHLANCRRERAEQAFDNRSLYGRCDVINCTDQILLCDIDAHMTKHLRNGDFPSSRQKRLRISLNDLKKCVVNSFSERKNTICSCMGNSR